MPNRHKTASANSTGIIISFRDVNKHQWLPYDNQVVNKIQIEGTVKYQKIETPVFSKQQDALYNEAIHGFKAYSEEELSKMSVKLKASIKDMYSKTQFVLNNWKQSIVNERVDNFLLSMFPKSAAVKALTNIKGTDPAIYNQESFKDLGISKKMIAHKLVEAHVLPQNFFNLI